jgi:hypothetical protein
LGALSGHNPHNLLSFWAATSSVQCTTFQA